MHKEPDEKRHPFISALSGFVLSLFLPGVFYLYVVNTTRISLELIRSGTPPQMEEAVQKMKPIAWFINEAEFIRLLNGIDQIERRNIIGNAFERITGRPIHNIVLDID